MAKTDLFIKMFFGNPSVLGEKNFVFRNEQRKKNAARNKSKIGSLGVLSRLDCSSKVALDRGRPDFKSQCGREQRASSMRWLYMAQLAHKGANTVRA